MSKKYKIGQVLYVVSPKTQSVVPVQVQEINQRTTIEGEETIYMVNDPENRGPHNLDALEVSGQVYTNAADVGRHLKDNANKAIDEMMQNAQAVSKSKFGSVGGAEDIFPSKKKRDVVLPPLPPSSLDMSKPEMPVEEGVEMVSVIGRDGKNRMQKTKVRIKGPDGKLLTA